MNAPQTILQNVSENDMKLVFLSLFAEVTGKGFYAECQMPWEYDEKDEKLEAAVAEQFMYVASPSMHHVSEDDGGPDLSAND
jgi:hypothetical protein